VRDTIARQLDVNKDSVKMEMLPGTGKYRIGLITFQTREGKPLDLVKLQSSLKATRLGKGTRSGVKFLEITAQGKVSVSEKETVLTVSGAGQQLRLADDPNAKPKKGEETPYQRLRAALAKGAKVTALTGRVQGWDGVWPEVLKKLAEKEEKPSAERMPVLLVTDFQIAREKK
jgi:hypothetical protein